MKTILAWVASAALAGAVLLAAPTDTLAATGATVTGVPATIDWGHADQGGSEARVRVDTIAPGIRMTATADFVPVVGITFLCNTAVFPSPTCSSGTNADSISRASMLWAARPDSGTCDGSTGAGNSCLNNACKNGAATGVIPFVSSPQTAGVGVAPKAAGFPLCRTAANVNGTFGCLDCLAAANKVIQIGSFYLGVSVPAGKNSGTYAATLTFSVN